MLTVLLCTHNDGPTIGRALRSALAQTAPRESFEILVIDDGSTDSTPSALASFLAHPRITVHRVEPNGGLVPACNIGLDLITTPFFTRLDGDDRLEPQLVQALLDASLARHANLVYSDRYELHPDGRRRVRALGDNLEVGELIAAGTLLPTGLVRELGGYRDVFWEEFDLYLRLLESGRCGVAHVPLPLYTYPVGLPGRMTTSDARVSRGWDELAELWDGAVLARYGLADQRGVPGRAV